MATWFGSTVRTLAVSNLNQFFRDLKWLGSLYEQKCGCDHAHYFSSPSLADWFENSFGTHEDFSRL
jgi:hypothetical protein